MPYKEKEIEKLYYSIGEIAEMLNVNTSLIRFWEKEFDAISPKKNKKGNRMFSRDDVQNLKLIYHLVKEKGYTLQGAQSSLKDRKNGAIQEMEAIERLQKVRSFLLEIKELL
ncbi:MAG: MerR family transcriptional regulator [Flavobacteriales bacterium]|nr:MerR family transcriptional regulator [Flavobacteriales bacterium]